MNVDDFKDTIWQDSGWLSNGAVSDILVRFSVKTSQMRHFPGHRKPAVIRVVSMVFIKSNRVYPIISLFIIVTHYFA